MRGVPDTYPAGRCMGRCEVVVVPTAQVPDVVSLLSPGSLGVERWR